MEEAEPSEEEEQLSETGEPEAPPPVLLRQCTVLIAQEGGPSLTDDDFPVGCFEIPATDSTDPATVAIVLVAELDHRLIACIPFQCWHRVVNKRVLPPKALIKPLVLELPFVDRTDTEAAVSHQKCWLGVLAPEFEDYVVFEASLDLADVDYKFLPGAPYCAPLAASLVEAFERHFGFVPATSGGGVGGAAPSKSTAAPLPGSTLDTRLQALENSVAAIAESLKQQTGAPSRPSALKKPVEPCPPPGLVLPTKSGGLDADVLRAAQLAGIPEDHIMQMSQLIARGKPKLSDLPAQRARKTTSGPLSESEDSSGEDEGDAEQSAGVQTESKTLAAAVSKLTKIRAEGKVKVFGGTSRRCWIGKHRDSRFGRHQKVCSCSSCPQESGVDSACRDFEDPGGKHAQRLQPAGTGARIRCGATYSTSLVRDEVKGAKFSDASASVVGHSGSSGLSDSTTSGGSSGPVGAVAGNGRSAVNRQRVVAVSRRNQFGGSSSAQQLLSPCATSRQRGSVHQAGGRSLDRLVPAEVERLRESCRQEAQVGSSQEHSSQSRPAGQTSQEGQWERQNKARRQWWCRGRRCAALRLDELHEKSGGSSAEDTFLEAEEPCFVDEALTSLPSQSAASPTKCMLASDSPQAVRFESPSTSTTARTSRRGTVNSDLGRKPWGCHSASHSQLRSDPVSKGPAAAVTETCRQAPGAAATTVEVGQIWNSILRWMLRGPRSRLRGFLHSSLHKRVNEVNIPRTSRPVWPMPLPYGDMTGCSQSEVRAATFSSIPQCW